MPTIFTRRPPFRKRRRYLPIKGTGQVPATVPVSNADWFFSPYNWFTSGSTYKQSQYPGAYFKVKFGGTSCRLDVDVSPLTGAGVSAGNYPTIAYSVDGGAWTRYQLTSGDSQLTLATGLAAATHTLHVVLVGAWWQSDRWTAPAMVLRVTGLTLDAGASVSAPDLQSGRAVVYGDSNGEGYEALGVGVSVANQDAGQAFPLLVGRALGCEVGVVAVAGQGFTSAGGGNVPDLEDSWDEYHSGASRLSGGLFDPAPDWVVCAMGQNDSSGVQTAAANLITAWRTAAPAANIAFVAPANLNQASAIQAAVTAAADDDCKYVTTGEDWLADESGADAYSNANHMNVRGHAFYGATAAAEIREAFGGSGAGVSGARIFGGF